MRTFLRSKIRLLFVAFAVVLAVPAVALAAELVTSELDTVTPNAVTVEQGGTTNFNIGLTATGAIASTITSSNASTATVDTAYSLSNTGAVSGSTPSSAFNFYSSGTGCSGQNCDVTWTGAPTPYSVGASVSAASTTPVGNYDLVLSDTANTTDLFNPSVSGGKLADANATKITVHVVAPTPPSDTTAPTLHLPGNITKEATSADGATASWDAPTADDANPAHPTVTCDADSGDPFPLGTTTVHCSATDAAGNTANGSFTVTVQDTTAPTLTLPADKIVEATGPSGAAVSYSPSASDLVDGSVNVTCTPASPHTFGLGTTTVDCSATDAHGNTANGSFTVTVQDTTPPELNLPANITKQATSNSQATVNFTATANDLVDGSRPVSCNPASGTSFSVGSTTVNCSSSDSRGNTSNGSFTVTVNFGWTGFFRPVDNPDTVNSVKAGQAIPVKFSLAGNQGLNIFAANFPVSQKITCDTSDPVDAIEETLTAGGSSLSYDSSLDQYNYVWKTDKSWAGTCRQLTVKTADGTPHVAIFKLLK